LLTAFDGLRLALVNPFVLNLHSSSASPSIVYWKKNDCNQTEVHEYACTHSLDGGKGFKFLRAENCVDEPTKAIRIEVPNAHSQEFSDRGFEDLQPDADIVENQIVYKQTFDVRYYPYEFHELRVSYESLYSTDIVSLSMLPNIDPGVLNPSVPPGWTLENVSCHTGSTQKGRAISEITGYDIFFPTFDCTIQVSRKNAGWWLTSFLLFTALIVIAFVGSLGVLSHYVAEAREDKEAARQAMFDGTRLEGTFTVGLLLVYVFQVQVSPYGKPIEFWPRIPASTMIYILGLVAIMTMSAAGLIGSMIFTRPLLVDGFVGFLTGPYDLDQIPKEGEVPEEGQPLLLKKYVPPDPNASTGTHDSPNNASDPRRVEEEKPLEKSGCEHDEDDGMKIAHARKNNQKMYNVLSVEEAIVINTFVRRLFYFKVALLSSVGVATIIILVTAGAKYNDLVKDAS
jgi:hypothetical protein